jgi:hypothetical protein
MVHLDFPELREQLASLVCQGWLEVQELKGTQEHRVARERQVLLEDLDRGVLMVCRVKMELLVVRVTLVMLVCLAFLVAKVGRVIRVLLVSEELMVMPACPGWRVGRDSMELREWLAIPDSLERRVRLVIPHLLDYLD